MKGVKFLVPAHRFSAVFLLLLLVFVSCEEQEKPREKEKPVYRKVPGEVQVLNACGIPGAADRMRDFLTERGFDVVEMGNYSHWNVPQTIIALRNTHWTGAEQLAGVLNTDKVVPLKNPVLMVDATVLVGQDFEEIVNGYTEK